MLRVDLGDDTAIFIIFSITATAHKLARLVYSMLRYGTAYADMGQQAYEQKHRDRVLTSLQRKAKAFGYQLV